MCSELSVRVIILTQAWLAPLVHHSGKIWHCYVRDHNVRRDDGGLKVLNSDADVQASISVCNLISLERALHLAPFGWHDIRPKVEKLLSFARDMRSFFGHSTKSELLQESLSGSLCIVGMTKGHPNDIYRFTHKTCSSQGFGQFRYCTLERQRIWNDTKLPVWPLWQSGPRGVTRKHHFQGTIQRGPFRNGLCSILK